MESKEINITYESLFEVLKREKEMTDLQKLEPNFFSNFIQYLNEKKRMLDKEDNLFSYDEKKKIEKQIDNARRIIKDIYDRREKKVINIALIKSRTKTNVLDTSAFLDNEKRFFESILRVLDEHRSKVIENILRGSAPELAKEASSGVEKKESPKRDTMLVRFLYSVPKFVGKELEEYGPFEEEDIANLPTEVAQLLVGKGRAEEIKESCQ